MSPFDDFLVTFRLGGISCLAQAVALCRSSSSTNGLHHSMKRLYGRATASNRKLPSVDTRSNDQSRDEMYGVIKGVHVQWHNETLSLSHP